MCNFTNFSIPILPFSENIDDNDEDEEELTFHSNVESTQVGSQKFNQNTLFHPNVESTQSVLDMETQALGANETPKSVLSNESIHVGSEVEEPEVGRNQFHGENDTSGKLLYIFFVKFCTYLFTFCNRFFS